MDTVAIEALEFPKITEQLKAHCVSGLGKDRCDRLKPETDPKRIALALQETTESLVVVKTGSQPLQGLHDVREPLIAAQKGAVLAPKDLLRIADMLRGASKFKRSKAKEMPFISAYSESIQDLPGIVQAVETAIEGDGVSDHADDDLRRVRKEIRIAESRIEQRLNAIISSLATREAVQEGFVTVKNGRWVVPIKASARSSIPGTVIAASSSGQTVFIEPAVAQPLMDKLVTLRAQEEDLVYQILCALTALVVDRFTAIGTTMEAMASCDFIFAKGRYSVEIGGEAPGVTVGGPLSLAGARHPLLPKDAVPVDIAVGGDYTTLVITGPNTGGKTVLLKTVGLLVLMTQAGLHIPIKAGGTMPVFQNVFVDIGDRQSIEQSLSTFSSHMANIASILKKAGEGSLVLLDEIGTGTDPREGAALAAGILDYLYRRGAVTLATTHYGDVKLYSEHHPGFMNGCMEFDEETLRPLFRLRIGISGQSQGLIIGRRLGLPEEVLILAGDYIQWMPGAAKPNGAGEKAERHAAFSQDPGVMSPSVATSRDEACGPPPKAASPKATPPKVTSPKTAEIVRIAAPEEQPSPPQTLLPREKQFLRGDSVFVHTVKQNGIVAREADERGNVVVLVRDKRVAVHRKRLKLLIKREDLYPGDDYDMNIVLMSKGDRKLMKTMSKRPTDEVRVVQPEPEPEK